MTLLHTLILKPVNVFNVRLERFSVSNNEIVLLQINQLLMPLVQVVLTGQLLQMHPQNFLLKNLMFLVLTQLLSSMVPIASTADIQPIILMLLVKSANNVLLPKYIIVLLINVRELLHHLLLLLSSLMPQLQLDSTE
jgi:hypothetical protein